MVKKLTIEVYGTRYAITTTEEPEHVRLLVKEIDGAMQELMRKGSLSLNQAFLLLTLQYLDRCKKSEQTADHLRAQVAEYSADAARAQADLDEAMRMLEKMEGGKNRK